MPAEGHGTGAHIAASLHLIVNRPGLSIEIAVFVSLLRQRPQKKFETAVKQIPFRPGIVSFLTPRNQVRQFLKMSVSPGKIQIVIRIRMRQRQIHSQHRKPGQGIPRILAQQFNSLKIL